MKKFLAREDRSQEDLIACENYGYPFHHKMPIFGTANSQLVKLKVRNKPKFRQETLEPKKSSLSTAIEKQKWIRERDLRKSTKGTFEDVKEIIQSNNQHFKREFNDLVQRCPGVQNKWQKEKDMQNKKLVASKIRASFRL